MEGISSNNSFYTNHKSLTIFDVISTRKRKRWKSFWSWQVCSSIARLWVGLLGYEHCSCFRVQYFASYIWPRTYWSYAWLVWAIHLLISVFDHICVICWTLSWCSNLCSLGVSHLTLIREHTTYCMQRVSSLLSKRGINLHCCLSQFYLFVGET